MDAVKTISFMDNPKTFEVPKHYYPRKIILNNPKHSTISIMDKT